MSHYDTSLPFIFIQAPMAKMVKSRSVVCDESFYSGFSSGILGIPGVNLWKVKVNGTFSSEMLIPPTIASEYKS